jgi:acyl transferase domain-containing protein
VPLPEGKIGRISLNNFGFGGSNAHAILEEAPKMQSTIQTENCITEPPFKKEQHCPQRLYLFSAKDETALKAHVKRFGDYLSHDPDSKDHLFMHDLSFTLCCRRTHFPRRVAMTAATRTELLTKLQGINQISRVSTSAKLGFVFTGQGSQWPRMGLDLMRYPEFSQKIQTAERCLKGLGASWSLIGTQMFSVFLKFVAALTNLLHRRNLQVFRKVNHKYC